MFASGTCPHCSATVAAQQAAAHAQWHDDLDSRLERIVSQAVAAVQAAKQQVLSR